MSAPLLSVVMVNFNSGMLILECLNSLYQYNSQLHFEVIVADNSSNARDRDCVTTAFPNVIWMDMGYNAGFARANNKGIRMAKGSVYLLLNPDTICTDDSISKCYQKLLDAGYAAAGLQLLDAAGQRQISGSYFVRGGLNHVLPIPYWGQVVRWLAYRAGSKVPGVQHVPAVQEVDWISGAFLMVKKAAVDKAGLMDEDFFLYGEEVEWCSRLKKTGSLVLFGELSIIHLEGATINKSQNIQEQGYYNLYDRKGLQLMVSNHLRVRKQYGVLWLLVLLLNYSWGFFFFLACGTVHRTLQGKGPFPLWKQAGRFGGNVLRLWTLLPSMIGNKPHFYKML